MSSPDFLLCSNEAIDAPRCNKETFPSGSPVAGHTNEKSPSAWFCIPRVHFLQQAMQQLLSLRRSSHVYAFVPHYSGPASADPHLAFKFPNQPASHAPMALALLQLYVSRLLFRQDCTLDADSFRRTVVWHRAALVHAEDRPPRLLYAHQHRSRLCQLIWLMQYKEIMMALITVFKIVK